MSSEIKRLSAADVFFGAFETMMKAAGGDERKAAAVFGTLNRPAIELAESIWGITTGLEGLAGEKRMKVAEDLASAVIDLAVEIPRMSEEEIAVLRNHVLVELTGCEMDDYRP
ncbi:MAG: hypothetical protein ABIJ82_00975 [Patescibacteria group bacterium]